MSKMYDGDSTTKLEEDKTKVRGDKRRISKSEDWQSHLYELRLPGNSGVVTGRGSDRLILLEL